MTQRLPSGSNNPYESPAVELARPHLHRLDGSSFEIRERYLRHELTIKWLGWVFIGGAVAALVYVTQVIARRDLSPSIDEAIYGVAAAVALALGSGLRRLDSRVRTPSIVFCAFGLLVVPLAGLIAAYFIWLLLCAKSNVVFSAEYREIMLQTPGVRHHIVNVLMPGISFALVGGAAIGLMLATGHF